MPQIAVEVVEIVTKTDCGLCVDTGSPEAIAEAIREAKNPRKVSLPFSSQLN